MYLNRMRDDLIVTFGFFEFIAEFILIPIVILSLIFQQLIKSRKAKDKPEEIIPSYKCTKMKNKIAVIMLIVEGLPLLIYPAVVVADIMAIADDPDGFNGMSIMLKACILLFIFLTLVYPITYGVCVSLYKKVSNKIIISLIPFWQIIVIICLGEIWSMMGK